MSEPSPKLRAAMAQVEAPWDAARTERTLHGLPARTRRRRRRTLLGGSAATALALLAGFALLRQSGTQTAQPPGSPHAPVAHIAPSARQLHLPDGSTVQLLAPDTDVVMEQSAPQHIVLRVRSGHARFDVAPRSARVFEVHTAQARFEVLGSVFELSSNVEGTWLRVETGRVALLSQGKRQLLAAGHDQTFAASQTVAPQLPGSESAPRAPGRAQKAAPVQRAHESWREHAEHGDFKQAFALLPPAPSLERMDVAELLLAADAARLSGHPRAAVPLLERVVTHHASDARAPLAAFTLGGVLMNQLGMPREAEAAYAKARATSLGGALAQDALARQVEAASRAGDEVLARRLARDYLEQYPEGRRVRAVRRFGGL